MYKRFIIYLYYYKKKEKKENCGYVKINIQNEECRIEINVKNISQIEGTEELYLLKKENHVWKKKKVTDVEAKQGVINSRHTCSFEEMAPDFLAEEIQGILIYDGKNILKAVCGTLTEEEISLSEVQEIKEVLETAELGHSRKESYEKESEEISENSVYEYDEECLKKKAENKSADCTEEIKIESCCTTLNEEENTQILSADTWQEKMFRVFPKVILYINGEKTAGIKLKPHDIVWFPGAYWRLASNKFLLNGYYNYRYILFFKGSGEYEGKYFLGTPGYFGVSDAMTAKKFGFTDFFMAGQRENEDAKEESAGNISVTNVSRGSDGRNFGFWCRET